MTVRCHLALSLLATASLVAACGEDEGAPPQAESAATGTPSATTAARPDEKVTFKLSEENGSGTSGIATLRGGDDGSTVVLAVERPGSSGPAHIHNVTCAEYRALKDFDAQLGTVDVPLTDLVDGRSKTSTDNPLSAFRAGEYSINVHSTGAGFPVTACGDIAPG